MKKSPLLYLLGASVLLNLCTLPLSASHPLLQNGWIKAATDTSVTIFLPPDSSKEATFTFAPGVKIEFENGVEGTAADLKALVAQMGNQRIILNIRRVSEGSMTAVIVGVKAPKPVPLVEPVAPAPEAS